MPETARSLGRFAPPLVLDLDSSVLPLEGEERIPLQSWQERMRFACTRKSLSLLQDHLREVMSAHFGCAFIGSGDFHHLTLALLRLLEQRTDPAPLSVDVVVLDNHPDNMRYPFGVHCGSWVSHAAALPWVRQVHVAGICSGDITWRHAWENRLTPLLRRKLTYWSVGRRAAWLTMFGREGQSRAFADHHALLAEFLTVLRSARQVYLSIDKDVLRPEVVRTNWDQGVFDLADLRDVIRACGSRMLGVDVCGEVSSYAYQGRFKRLLSALDGQGAPDAADLREWQEGHRSVNREILRALRE